MKRELVALLCVVHVCVLCLFLTVPWIGLQSDFGISWSYSLSGVKLLCKTGASESYPVFPDIISNIL